MASYSHSPSPLPDDLEAPADPSSTIPPSLPPPGPPLSPSIPPSDLPPRACLFDFHGTLTPYCRLSLSCINLTLSSYSLPPFPSTLSALFNGAWRDEAISFVYDWLFLQSQGVDYSEFFEGYNKNRIQLSKERTARKGALEVLETLVGRVRVGGGEHRGERVEMCLVNGGKRAVFEKGVEDKSGIAKFFGEEECVTVGDIERRKGKVRKKPHPDVYLLALETVNEGRVRRGLKGDVKPEECLVFEDSFNGVKSAFRAGMRVVWTAEEEVQELMRIVEEEGDPVEYLIGGHDATMFVRRTLEKKVLGAVETMGFCVEYRESLEGFDFSRHGFEVVDESCEVRSDSGIDVS